MATDAAVKKCSCQKMRANPRNLADAEWAELAPWLPEKTGGRPREHPLREIVDALSYWLRTGGAWEELPHDFPPKGTVCDYWRQWTRDGIWRWVQAALRERVRTQAGKATTPTVALEDTQTVSSTQFPSSAMTWPGSGSRSAFIQRKEQAVKAAGASRAKTRPKGSCEGMPWGRSPRARSYAFCS